ncbi:unnamed protein product [Enterobius vermicularis]|uniref:Rx_N domain-containing protein n=1 Tax=Enterobius vermicularis TaxID=51028 RepID=A0A0N4UZE2_ENTVE|nr:unnamed protein product [Enterobius vermicularis]
MAISRKELTASVIMKIFGKIVDSAMLLAETLLELWRKRPTFVKGKKAEVTLLFFTVSALDVIGKVDEVIDSETKETFVEWIYRLQLTLESGTE